MIGRYLSPLHLSNRVEVEDAVPLQEDNKKGCAGLQLSQSSRVSPLRQEIYFAEVVELVVLVVLVVIAVAAVVAEDKLAVRGVRV